MISGSDSRFHFIHRSRLVFFLKFWIFGERINCCVRLFLISCVERLEVRFSCGVGVLVKCHYVGLSLL